MKQRPCTCLGIVLLLAVFFASGSDASRTVYKMDYNWKFFSLGGPLPDCQPNAFPINMNGIQCFGLSNIPAANSDDCARQCCNDDACETYQWCPANGRCSPQSSCWVGSMESCSQSQDWVSRGRNVTPPVVPKCTVPYCQPSFDDSNWRQLDIPHDYVVEGNFTPSGDQGHGFLPHGKAWYRKHFPVAASALGSAVWIYFEGIYRNSNVYLNGYFVGNHPSGYTSFYYNIESLLNYGADNLLAIEVDATHNEGWWYEGGGIYRHVWLNIADKAHILPWGIYAPSTVSGTIKYLPTGIVASSATVNIYTQIINGHPTAATLTVLHEIYDPTGSKVETVMLDVTIPAGENTTVNNNAVLSNVLLWDTEAPNLYKIVTTVLDPSKTQLDQETTRIGLRTIAFDKDNGFFLNGRPLKIKGFCNHQDFAGLGIALPKRVNEFRVKKLQEMGANAWRMSHNPPNVDLLDLTDELGMLVWDENRNFDDNPQYYADLATLPLRDRNHPSIIIWSLCNEFGCQEGANDQKALATAQSFRDIIKSYDKTRPISAAWNAGLNDLLYGWGPKVLDLQGVNYNYGEYDPYHKQYPDKPMIASETASCTGARGIYVTNDTAAHKSIFSAHGCAQGWWTADETRNFISGGFAWTGFDYKGEPTPYGWPCINSNFGVIDIAGFPKDTFWYYQSWWINSTVLHVFPHWNKPQNTGTLSVTSCATSDNYQNFKFTGSSASYGQIVNSEGKCLDAPCTDITKGCIPLGFVSCGSSSSQYFIQNADKSFQNQQNKGCLDLWDSGVGPGVGVYSCDGGSNQHWDITGSHIQSEAGGDRCLSSGPSTPVWVYSNAASLELFVNGVSQGKKSMPALDHVEWSPSWAAGNIKVVAYDASGKIVGTETVVTTGAPASVKLEVEFGNEGITADKQDVALIKASIVDAAGLTVPTASNLITFTITGQGSLAGVGNGDPSCHEPDKGTKRSAFNGLARAIVRSSDVAGIITVTATSPGLSAGQVQVKTVMPQFRPYRVL